MDKDRVSADEYCVTCKEESMTATEELPSRAPTIMAEPREPDTKTVRVAAEIANKLQTISALAKEMGRRFNAVDFLNGLLAGPVNDLHTETVAAYTEHQSVKAKSKKK
jgi:hypothetical protein